MKESKQYPLPVDLHSSSTASELPVKQECPGKTVSISTFASIQRDRKTHEIAKRYVECYKIFG